MIKLDVSRIGVSLSDKVHQTNEERFDETYAYLFDEKTSPDMFNQLCHFKDNIPSKDQMQKRMGSVEAIVDQIVKLKHGHQWSKDDKEDLTRSSSSLIEYNIHEDDKAYHNKSQRYRYTAKRNCDDCGGRRDTVDPSLLEEILRSMEEKESSSITRNETDFNTTVFDPNKTRLSSFNNDDCEIMTPLANSSHIKLKRLASVSGKRGTDSYRMRLTSPQTSRNDPIRENSAILDSTNESNSFELECSRKLSCNNCSSIEIARKYNGDGDDDVVSTNITCDLALKFDALDIFANESNASLDIDSTNIIPCEQSYSRQNFDLMIHSLSQSPIEHRQSSQFSIMSNSSLSESEDEDQIVKSKTYISKNVSFCRSPHATRIITFDTVDTSTSSIGYSRDHKKNLYRIEFDSDKFKYGSRFRMPPIHLSYEKSGLQSKHNKEKRFDYERFLPKQIYSSRLESHLEEIKVLLMQNNTNDDLNDELMMQRKIVASLSLHQTQATILSLLEGLQPFEENNNDRRCISGETLIVLSHKNELDSWELALREHSSCSVLNHGVLTPRSRREIFVSRCAGFDIVLTTADCIKSKEHTFQVNSFGCVINSSPNEDWFDVSCERSTKRKCLQLSLLHKLHWKRVIFVDFPDNKSFVTKANTLKSAAAAAISSSSR